MARPAARPATPASRPSTPSAGRSTSPLAHNNTGGYNNARSTGASVHNNPSHNPMQNNGRSTGGQGNTARNNPAHNQAGSQSRTFKSSNGGEARFGSRGEVRQAKVNGMTITHGPGGSRQVVRERPGGVRVVSHAGGGYVQHGYSVGRDRFVARTYVYHGARYERFYRPYFYHGVAFDVYLPRYYYGPAFYGWVYAPWRAAVYYNWAFTASPWYAYYGGYFAPYPVYYSPSLWLTDYLMASSLQQAYQNQAANAAAAAESAAAPLTPEVKQAIADEIRRQIALENMEQTAVAQNSTPDAGSSGSRGCWATTRPMYSSWVRL